MQNLPLSRHWGVMDLSWGLSRLPRKSRVICSLLGALRKHRCMPGNLVRIYCLKEERRTSLPDALLISAKGELNAAKSLKDWQDWISLSTLKPATNVPISTPEKKSSRTHILAYQKHFLRVYQTNIFREYKDIGERGGTDEVRSVGGWTMKIALMCTAAPLSWTDTFINNHH